MELEVWEDLLMESEEMDIGYKAFRNRTIEALSSDEVQCLIDNLQNLRPGGEGLPNITQPSEAAHMQAVLR